MRPCAAGSSAFPARRKFRFHQKPELSAFKYTVIGIAEQRVHVSFLLRSAAHLIQHGPHVVAERACPAGARQHRAAIAIFQCAVIRPAFVLINSHIGSVPPHDEAACHTQFNAQDIFLRDRLATGYGVRVGKSVRGVGVKGQPGIQISWETEHFLQTSAVMRP